MDENKSPRTKDTSNIVSEDKPRHLTIAEMAEKFDVTYRALRFYQQKGLLSPKRRGSTRLYQPRDIAHMKIIMDAKRTGLALTDVRDVLSAYHQKGIEQQNQIIVEKLQYQEKLLTEQHQLIGDQLVETRRQLGKRGTGDQ